MTAIDRNLARVSCRRAAFAEILPVRHAVLRPGLPLDTAKFPGDDAESTHHFGAFVDGRAVACLSIMQNAFEQWNLQLRGMAVDAAWQRSGVGGALLKFAEQDGISHDGRVTWWCNAREAASPFYLKQGWRIISERFEIAGVGPHFRMAREVIA